VLYEMLTGAHPFQADTPMGMLIQQLNTQPAPPESIHAVAPAISALVLKSLKKEPADRFQSAAEMLTALRDPETWFASQSQPRPASSYPTPRPASPFPTARPAPAVPPPPPPSVFSSVPRPIAVAPPAATIAPMPNPTRPPLGYAGAGADVTGDSTNRGKYLLIGGVAAVVLLAAAGIGIGLRRQSAKQITGPAPAGAVLDPTAATPASTPSPALPPAQGAPASSKTEASPSAGGLYQQAMADDKRKDYKDAAQLYQQSCNLGDVQSCVSLGQYYYEGGYGFKKDPVKALALFRKSCDGSDAVGCARAGDVLTAVDTINGHPSLSPLFNQAQAAPFLVKGCDGGVAESCRGLGLLYEGGFGVPGDRQKGAMLLQKGCSLGEQLSCDTLSRVLQSTATTPAPGGGLHAPTKIPGDIVVVRQGPAPAPANAGRVQISAGVIAGMLISQPQPVYPPIAKAAHVQGLVVLHAIISKQGTIESLNVVSGPAMLQAAAVDAVKQWRYTPYLINGAPTEVDTTININFTLNGSPAAAQPNPGAAP
jgi:TonB family protein